MLKKLKIKWNSIVYPFVLAGILLVTILLLAKSISFFTQAINTIFSDNIQLQEASIVKLQFNDYLIVAKKLGLAQNNVMPRQSDSNIELLNTSTTAAYSGISTTATPSNTDQTSGTLTKTQFSIAIYNGVNKAGLAVRLKDALVAAGYRVDKVGNMPGLFDTTVIRIKDSKIFFLPQLLENVAKVYRVGESQRLEESEKYDAVIIIGKNM